VVVERRGLDGDDHPDRRRLGLGPIADDKAAQRIVGIDGGGVGREHV